MHHQGGWPIGCALYPPELNGGAAAAAEVPAPAAALLQVKLDPQLRSPSVFRSVSSAAGVIAASISVGLCQWRTNYLLVRTSNNSRFVHDLGPTMPRTKASPKKCVKSQVANNTLLLILKGDALTIPEGCDGKPNMVKLRHPQTSSQAMFFFSADNKMVQEILSFSEDKRSWVIDDHIQSDGKVHLSTPIDPLFLILPYLTKSAGRFEPLEQLVQDEDFPETKRLMQCISPKQLGYIADTKAVGDESYYRVNEEKTVKWLVKKAKRVANILKEKGIHVGPGAVSANFIRGSRHVDLDSAPGETEFLQYSYGILSEYISVELCLQLRNALGLPEESSLDDKKARKRKMDESDPDAVKKTRLEDIAEESNSKSEPKAEKAPPKKESAKDKAMARAAAGTKSIASFFKKK